MKRITLLLTSAVIAIMSLFLVSCEGIIFSCLKGNGITIEEERHPGEFTGIISEGDYDVYIIVDSVYKVVIKADENLIPYIRTIVKSDKLIIDNGTRRCLRNDGDKPIEIYAHTPEVVYAALEGSGVIYSDYLIYGDYLRVELTGSGITDLRNIDVTELDALITGSGEIELWGLAGSGDLNISGSGKIKASHLEQDECSASISGSGDMYIFVYDFLDANITGSGNIFYRGNPQINIKITGSGSLINNNK